MRRFSFVGVATLAIGLLCVGFVPLSHLSKRLLSGPSRFSALTARELLVDEIQVTPLLSTPDRFLMPFVAELWDDVRQGRESNKAWAFPSIVAFDPEAGPRYASSLACFLSRTGSTGVVWGLESFNLRERSGDQARVTIGLGVWNEVHARLSAVLIVYEFRDGMYLRGRIDDLRIASLETGLETPLLVRGQTAPGVVCL